MKAILIGALLVTAPTFAQTKSNDRLCKAIGDTPNDAVPPRDRAFFQDRCDCLIGECVYKGSARHKRLLAVVQCKVTVKQEVSKSLGRDLDAEEPLGSHEHFGMTAEVLCMEDPSPKKVMKQLAFAINEQRDIDAEAAERKRKSDPQVEEKSRKRQQEEHEREVKLASLKASGDPDAIVQALVACLADPNAPDCKALADTYWEACEKKYSSTECQRRYEAARAASPAK